MIWTVLAASVAVYSWKLIGYLVPERFIGGWFRNFAERVTVVLLVGLVGVQAFTSGQELVLDARLPALLVAAIMFALRVPYIIVVLAAAITAAAIRFFLGL